MVGRRLTRWGPHAAGHPAVCPFLSVPDVLAPRWALDDRGLTLAITRSDLHPHF